MCVCVCVRVSSAFSRLNYLTFLCNKKARKGEKKSRKKDSHVHKSQRYTEECTHARAHAHAHTSQCQTRLSLILHQCLASRWKDKPKYRAAGSALHWARYMTSLTNIVKSPRGLMEKQQQKHMERACSNKRARSTLIKRKSFIIFRWRESNTQFAS